MDDLHFNLNHRKEKIALIRSALDQKVTGQEPAKKAITQLWTRHFAKVGCKNSVPAILLVGPTGAGKTLLATTSAQAIGYPTTSIPMGNYSKLSADQFRLRVYHSLLENPHRLIIFDQFDRASTEVQEAAMTMIEKGVMEVNIQADSKGLMLEEVSVRNNVFILTTQAGTDELVRDYPKGGSAEASIDSEELKKMISHPRQENSIPREALDRLLAIVPMLLPTQHEYQMTAKAALDQLLHEEAGRVFTSTGNRVTFQVKNLQSYLQATTKVSDSTNYWSVSSRVLRPVEDAIANRVIEGDFKDGETIELEIPLPRNGVKAHTSYHL